MRVCDQALWNLQCRELETNQIGRDFLSFLQTWVDQAEKLHDEEIGSWTTALRHALDHADIVHGRVSAHFMGQMLVVIATHWEHGQEAVESMSSIELRLVQDMLALKVAELQQQAGEDPVIGDD